jgi:hypothetical protein
VHAGETRARHASHLVEVPADHDLPIGLQGDGVYDPDWVHDRIEGVGRAVRVEARQFGAWLAAYRGEDAAHHDLPVRLLRQASDPPVRVGVEAGVQRAVRVQPYERVVVQSRDQVVGPYPSDHDLPVLLHEDGKD